MKLSKGALSLLWACSPSLSEARKYGYNHRIVKQDSAKAARHFPDIDVELYSPAFLNPDNVPASFSEGKAGPTDDHTLDSFVRDLASRNEWMKHGQFNFTSDEGRMIPYLHLSQPSQSDSQCKVKVWVQAAVHGDEPGGDQAALALLGELDANQAWTKSLLDHLEIMVIPRYNPDGVFYLQDTFANNHDPNRDHTKLANEFTRNMKHQVNDFDPHVILDMHEYTATRQYNRYHMASDSLFAPSKNLNIHNDIRKMAEGIFKNNIEKALDQKALSWDTYFTGTESEDIHEMPLFKEAGSDAKIGRNALGMTQAIAFLSETRGIQLTDQHFRRRVVTGLTVASAILQTAADNSADVCDTVKRSRQDFIDGNEDIVVTDHTTTIQKDLILIDVTDDSLVNVTLEFESATPAIANITRTRPEAYIIPAGWSNLVDRMLALGLDVDKMTEPWTGEVEFLVIKTADIETEYYEGTIPVAVTVEAETKTISLPAGSHVVSTRQKNAALAFAVLEPENIDSFVSFNLIPVEVGDEYPIFRLMA